MSYRQNIPKKVELPPKEFKELHKLDKLDK